MSSVLHRIVFGNAGSVGAAPPAWSPTDLGANLIAWYKGDVGVQTDVDGVHTWQDQSGNGNDLTQATGAKKPQKTASYINGITGVVGDGVDDQMTISITLAAQPNTFFAVLKVDTLYGPAAGNKYILGQTTGNFHIIGLQTDVTGTNEWAVNAGAWLKDGDHDTVAHYMLWLFNTTASTIRLDGTQIVSGNSGTKGCDNFAPFGNATANQTNVGMIELGFVDKALSAGEQSSLETYLAGRAGL